MKKLSKILIVAIVILFFEVVLFTPLGFLTKDVLMFCSYPNTVFEYIILPKYAYCNDTFNPFYYDDWQN